jgi:lipoprotein-releasing system permease protein
MMILVGIIFLVVDFNVYHSLRRRVFERMEEIAVLKAVGIPPILIQGIFILEGLFIGLAGSVSGLLLGLAISMNVNGVFTLVERAGNALIAAVRLFASPFSSASGGSGFAIFSPMYFYLDSVPSRVYPGEAFLVVFFALLACIAAAGVASRAVARFRPAEILRYE